MKFIIHIILLGVQLLQHHVYNSVYKKALGDTKHIVNLQVFRMVLCGVPRSGKTTFWKRIAIKDFEPSEESASTGVAESYYISAIAREKQESGLKLRAHLEYVEILFDLHLDEDRDLDSEALTIYKLILERHKPKPIAKAIQESQDATHKPQAIDRRPQAANSKTPVQEYQASEAYNEGDLKADKSSQPATDSEKYSQANKGQEDNTKEPIAQPLSIQHTQKRQPSDPIITEINKHFDNLNDLLKSTDLPDILNIKQMCHLQDTGGQRAFLELLPTLSTGKALYLIFFNYKDFTKSVSETMQAEGSPEELLTGIQYEQIDVIMQSLICVSTASKVIQSTVEDQPTEPTAEPMNNVALLVGTRVDEVTSEDVRHADEIIKKRVKPFLRSKKLMHADAEAENLVLKVAINNDDLCSNDPKDYVKVIMKIVDDKLKNKESEELPASWFMFFIMLRRLQSAGYSVLQYSHCQQIAEWLYIRSDSALKSLLFRLQNVFGIVLYFPEVKGLEDIVICDPAFVYKSISELIFESFHGSCDVSLLKKLRKQGIFKYEELEKYCKIKQDIELYKLIVLLKHLGIIAPVKRSNAAQIADKDDSDNEDIHPDQEYVIPCVLKEAKENQLDIQLKNSHACSIIPLRIYFDCEFAPMGGFCYLFTKLISDNKGWKLCIPDIWDDENSIYWRNKVTFEVKFDSRNYLVTLLSTDVYYEIHIIHLIQSSNTPFQLQQDGHSICKHVWNAMHTTLEKSPNKSLQAYRVACFCTNDDPESDKHVMKFKCKPHENLPNIEAECEKCGCYPPLDMQPSVMVWFKVR